MLLCILLLLLSTTILNDIVDGKDSHMQACNHEEADTRILINLQDALDNGSTTCLAHTVDTDVIVIIVGKFYDLLQQHPAADI